MKTQSYDTTPTLSSLTEYPPFSERLKYAMDTRDCSTQQLAHSLFLAPSTISGYRCGTRTPDCNTLRRIALELNVSSDFLLGLSNHIQESEIITNKKRT